MREFLRVPQWDDNFAYYLREDFPVDESAPISDTLQIDYKQVDGQFSIASGRLSFTAQSTPVVGDLGLVGIAGYSRTNGLTFVAESKLDATNKTYPRLLWTSGNSLSSGNIAGSDAQIFINFEDSSRILCSSVGTTTMGTYSANTSYFMALVLKRMGGLGFIKGGAFTDWTLLFVSYTNSGAENPVYPMIAHYNSTGSHDLLRVAQLTTPFTNAKGLATFSSDAPSNDEIQTGAADCFVHILWTPQTSETLNLYLRRTDDNNAVIVRCSQANSTIKAISKVSAVETEKSSVAQTWLAGTQYRIRARLQGTNLLTFVDVTAKNSTTTLPASSATGTKINSDNSTPTLSNWELYQYTFSSNTLVAMQLDNLIV